MYIYIWLFSSNLSFNDWNIEVLWSFNWYFEYDGWWLTLIIFHLIQWVNWWLNFFTFNSCWWYDHFWIILVYHLPIKSLPTNSPLSTLFTLQRLVIFYHSNGIIFTRIAFFDSYCITHSFIIIINFFFQNEITQKLKNIIKTLCT